MVPLHIGYIKPLSRQISFVMLGENGEPVYTSMAEKSAADRSTREFGFNMVASDKISMDRAIPDTRLDE